MRRVVVGGLVASTLVVAAVGAGAARASMGDAATADRIGAAGSVPANTAADPVGTACDGPGTLTGDLAGDGSPETLDVQSWSWGAEQPHPPAAGTDKLADLHVVLAPGQDTAVPGLLAPALVKSTHIPLLTFKVKEKANKTKCNASITRVQVVGVHSTLGANREDTVDLTYRVIYLEVDPGTGQPATHFGWDRLTHRPVSASPAPQAG